MKNKFFRSPLFYVGDKYKLVPEIKALFPDNIRQFVEPFVGGGSVFMNVEAETFLLNDIDSNVISIHKMLCERSCDKNSFFEYIDSVIKRYNLSCSYRCDVIPEQLKRENVKTFYARFNKAGYEKMRLDYNQSKKKNTELLYLLLIYGFNRMLRFNKSNNFNLPVGNVDFNKNTEIALIDYFDIVQKKKPLWYNMDFEEFLNSIELTNEDFIYLDPPYLITFSEYNKLWNVDVEQRLLDLLDVLNDRGIRFAISNVTHYRERQNDKFIEWANNYEIHSIKSNYISYHDNSIKKFNEVLVTNY